MSTSISHLKSYILLKAEKWQDFASGKELGQKKKAQDLFNRCEPGDIVYAKIPVSDWNLAKIKPEKRIRPYLLLRKEKNYFWAVSGKQSASKFRFRLDQMQKIEMNCFLLADSRLEEAQWQMIYHQLAFYYPARKEESTYVYKRARKTCALAELSF